MVTVFVSLFVFRADGHLFDKEAILQYILTQKKESMRKLKEFEKQKARLQVGF